jgi:hypothetical protein
VYGLIKCNDVGSDGLPFDAVKSTPTYIKKRR